MQFTTNKTKLLCTVTVSTITLASTSGNKRATEQRCLALLQHCNTLSKLNQVHTHILKFGLQNNPLVLTKFTATSSDLHAVDYASSFLFSLESDNRLYDTFLFNTVIKAYAQTNNLKGKAIFIYNLILHYNVLPNKFTYPFVLKACAGIGNLNLGKSVHGSVLKFRFDNDMHVQNTMVHMYCCGREGIEFARKVFDKMGKLDLILWSAMIDGYAHLCKSSDTIGLFRQIQITGVCPYEITMVSVLSTCIDLGAFELRKWAESYVEKERVQKTIELCNALIDMFAKCGDVDKAIKLFRNMKENQLDKRI